MATAATKRPIAFILAASNHGTMILNRNDYHLVNQGAGGYGVGYQILSQSCFDSSEVELVLAILGLRRKYYGDGVFAIDCGANIGVHTVEWAKQMYGWGSVHGFEAQERIYYALAGNVAINNCLNAKVEFAALGSQDGAIKIPVTDPLVPASFGSLELRYSASNENIGQPINYNEAAMQTVALKSLDSYGWERVDFIKIDVEGMEDEVLAGASETIQKCKPAMLIEIIKTDQGKIERTIVEHGYKAFTLGINRLLIHQSDAILAHFEETKTGLTLKLQQENNQN